MNFIKLNNKNKLNSFFKTEYLKLKKEILTIK